MSIIEEAEKKYQKMKKNQLDKGVDSSIPTENPIEQENILSQVSQQSLIEKAVASKKSSEKKNNVEESNQVKKSFTATVPPSSQSSSQNLSLEMSEDKEIIKSFQKIKRQLLDSVIELESSEVTSKDLNYPNLIMVTSANRREGSSFVSIHLACSIAAELDRTVLLIDTDDSKEGVGKFLGIDQEKGLLNILSSDKEILDDKIYKTYIPFLSFLPVGQSQFSDIKNLYTSRRMFELIREMSTRYQDRIIIFDAPPLLSSTEINVLLKLMGQTILVVKADHTSDESVQACLSMIHQNKSIPNLILNHGMLTDDLTKKFSIKHFFSWRNFKKFYQSFILDIKNMITKSK